MHFAELTAPEQRVLGCLIEKRWTTPDQYPLTLNALRLACNQSTNRDPVTGYDETAVRVAAQRLCQYGIARLASGHSSRATKYRHLAEESFNLGREELAVLAVLLLRGPQTPGELKSRTERMTPFESLDQIERVLETLIERGYARRIERRPGQKEERFEHRLGGADAGVQAETAAAAPRAHDVTPRTPFPPTPSPAPTQTPAPVPSPAPAATPAAPDPDLADRLAALEAEVRELRRELKQLLAAAGGSDGENAAHVGSASPTR
jgi:uncharacterized protein